MADLALGKERTNFFEEVKVGELGSDLAPSEGVLLVWNLGIELPPSVFIKEFVSGPCKRWASGK